jgi:SAM-dependent methyltransferase
MPIDVAKEAHEAWEKNAAWWDEHIGADGNAFHRELIGPAQLRLLGVQPGERVLDIACGNGQFSREIARIGADVVAFDFSATFIERAKQHSETESITNIDYRVLDATDETQLGSLGDRDFDAAVCTMALMDIPLIDPLLTVLPALLKPSGRFVFSVQHPCFNSNGIELVEGTDETRPGVLVHEYLDLPPGTGIGIDGQPEPHMYFHRPLHELLGACFQAGFAMDGIEEPAFGPEAKSERGLGWRNYSQIPPVLAVRMLVAG